MRDAQSLGPDDLVAAHYLLARVGRDGLARTPWADRIRVAAMVGFAGLGAQPHDYARALEAGEARGLRRQLDDSGVCMAEIDGFPVRWDADADSEERRRLEDLVFAMADEFGARHAIYPLVPPDYRLPDRGFVLDELARVCDRARRHDLLVSVEFLPFVEPINDVAATWDLVREVDRDNCGVNVDFWHHHAGAGDEAALRSVPGERIFSIHLTDGAPDLGEPDPMRRTMRQRKFPGEGRFPMTATLRALREIGCRAPFTLETASAEHWILPVDEYAARAYAAARSVLVNAGTSAR